MGVRVCKQLRRDLPVNCSRDVLYQSRGTFERTSLCGDCVWEDFARLPEHVVVTLASLAWWESGCLGTLGDAKGAASS
eukprot:2665384-Rhodomonas_salina.1